jgi:hypothetical protein
VTPVGARARSIASTSWFSSSPRCCVSTSAVLELDYPTRLMRIHMNREQAAQPGRWQIESLGVAGLASMWTRCGRGSGHTTPVDLTQPESPTTTRRIKSGR